MVEVFGAYVKESFESGLMDEMSKGKVPLFWSHSIEKDGKHLILLMFGEVPKYLIKVVEGGFGAFAADLTQALNGGWSPMPESYITKGDTISVIMTKPGVLPPPITRFKVMIDRNLCKDAGLCYANDPDHFIQADDGKAMPKGFPINPAAIYSIVVWAYEDNKIAAAKLAEASCPYKAIKVMPL